MTTSNIMKKINDLEKSLQNLKLQLFFSGKINALNDKSTYKNEDFVDEVRSERKQIWNKSYAKKI
ncbi:MAG: hypothetical protein Q7R95_01375 [bacterium]|nr:hypothetical protein [bacterium]